MNKLNTNVSILLLKMRSNSVSLFTAKPLNRSELNLAKSYLGIWTRTTFKSACSSASTINYIHVDEMAGKI